MGRRKQDYRPTAAQALHDYFVLHPGEDMILSGAQVAELAGAVTPLYVHPEGEHWAAPQAEETPMSKPEPERDEPQEPDETETAEPEPEPGPAEPPSASRNVPEGYDPDVTGAWFDPGSQTHHMPEKCDG